MAASCDCAFDPSGAEALDWRKSAPIRVIRGPKLKKSTSLFAPEHLRYDGIYKIARYWKELESEGFFVWKFLFIRDDVEPAPWTAEGVKYILDNNLIFSEDENLLLRFQRKRKVKAESFPHTIRSHRSGSKKQRSRVASAASLDAPQASVSSPTEQFESSREPSALAQLISLDTKNKELWEAICSLSTQSKQQFLAQVRQAFTCMICCKIVEATAPCTPPCGHNFCRPCLQVLAHLSQGLCPYVLWTAHFRNCFGGGCCSNQY